MNFRNKALLVFFIIAASIINASPPYAPKGDVRKTTIDDFYKHPKVGDDFNETWRYNITLTNGTKIFLNYTSMKVPMKGTQCGTNISLFNFHGKNYQVGRQYPAARFKQDKSQQLLSIKNATGKDNVFYMKGKPGPGHTIKFLTSKNEGFNIELLVTKSYPGLVKGDGIFDIRGKKTGLFIHLPSAEIKGTVHVGNIKEHVTGTMYMEQIWQSHLSTETSSHAFQMYGDKSPLMGNIIVGSKSLNSNIFGYAINRQDTTLIFPKIVTSKGATISYKSSAISDPIFTFWDRERPFIGSTFTRQQRYSVLLTIDGWFAKKAAKMAMGGEAIFNRGVGLLNNLPIDYNFYQLDD
ncbi:MAG: hypothetical protein OCC49_02460 [Fibrobacterales bacterium]